MFASGIISPLSEGITALFLIIQIQCWLTLLAFLMSEQIFILPSFLKAVYSGCRITGWKGVFVCFDFYFPSCCSLSLYLAWLIMTSFILIFIPPHKVSFYLECWQCFPFITDFKHFWGILVCIFSLTPPFPTLLLSPLYCTSWVCRSEYSHFKNLQPYFLKYFSLLSCLWGITIVLILGSLTFHQWSLQASFSPSISFWVFLLLHIWVYW